MNNNYSPEKIGILGGTFNPIHIGHLIMAEYAKETLHLDKVLFIPTGVSYMKNPKEIVSGDIRLEMIDLSIKDTDAFQSSDIELRREGNTYTYETLEALQKSYPHSKLYFIVGTDCLFSIENWYLPQRIFDSCTLVAVNRNSSDITKMQTKAEELKNKFQAEIELIHIPCIEISSTIIRERINQNKSIRYFVTDSVYDYIYKYKLYQNNDEEIM